MTHRSDQRIENLSSPEAFQGRFRDQDDTCALHRGPKGEVPLYRGRIYVTILSLSSNAQGLANREEAMHGLLASVLRTFHGSQRSKRSGTFVRVFFAPPFIPIKCLSFGTHA